MERIIDDEKTIERARQIYARRNGISLDSNRKKYFSIYKFLFQLLVLFNLAICVVLYKNKDFVFSADFLNNVNELYNINITEKVENFFMSEDENNLEEIKSEEVIENANQSNPATQSADQVLEQQSNVEKNITDIIKESYSFITPIEGTITSFFGVRESSNENISKNHTGIDISAIEGTKIKAAISGKVIQVSNKGNYGKHIKIQNLDIVTLYAHCKEIYVKEGDEIFQGQDIAEVGNTGKSTGPHLHFEIRYKDEYINPCDILEF